MGRVARRRWLGAIVVAVAAGFGSNASRAESATRVLAIDFDGAVVDPETSHASISRVLPRELSPYTPSEDRDALRFVVVGRKAHMPLALTIVSTRPDGARLDELEDVALGPTPCPPGTPEQATCETTPPIRACSDFIDAGHPAVAARSVVAEVGGRLAVMADDRELLRLPVGGPRHTALGPIDCFRVKTRVRIVRVAPGGALPFGSNPEDALARIRHELAVASRIWGQCGIHFGLDAELDVAVVDPPPPYLLAVGCGLGLPSSGGRVRFAVGAEIFDVEVAASRTPIQVARTLAARMRDAGLDATVIANPRTDVAALPTADVLVRDGESGWATLSPLPGQPLSSDASLEVCLGAVDFTDGLDHFTNADSAAGTVEERSLIRAYSDEDPTTVEIFIIPGFAGSTRIGESFGRIDGASIANTVIIDRVGIAAGAKSYALAHELGHVLLAVPGHPDDFGVDRPSQLMDADAVDGTIFGPRRLPIDECERALRQSGPQTPVPLLQPWPLAH